MPFLRPRRQSSATTRTRRRTKQPTLRDELDWSVHPDTAREVLGIIFATLGILFIISIFGLAGAFGKLVLGAFQSAFGLFGFIVPIIFLIMGIKLLLPRDEKEPIKASVIIGLVVAFLTIPSLLVSYGGSVGLGVFHLASRVLSPVGGYLVLLAISVASILVSANISLGYLLQKLKVERTKLNNTDYATSPKANVFTLKDKSNRETSGNTATVTNVVEGDWEYPSLDLLSNLSTHPDPGNIAKNSEAIKKTLKDFAIDVSMGEANIGPTVTQYTLKPAEGVKLNQITARSNDLALAMSAKSLRVEAPIPGKPLVGVEVPNKVGAIVTLREMMETEEFQSKAENSNLTLALGRAAAGEPFVVDLKSMPHLLIAGATGSGKSVAINSIILNLLFQNSPADLRFLMVDPKRVELTGYNGIPHLLAPVVVEADKTISLLKWAMAEMDRRFELFASSAKRNIEAYNEEPTEGKLPYIVIIIDELADLMVQSAKDVEGAIVRLAQMARATGIHLIVATQRPSVDVITGLIKANIPTRMAFAVAAQADSRTILDSGGAEKLLGKGDMLYASSDMSAPMRAQGVFVNDKEIKAVTDFLRRKGEVEYDEEITNYKAKNASSRANGGSHDEIDDDMFEEAKELSIQTGKISASLLQRRLRIGYARAARLLDLMEQEGIIGPPDGARPREVLISSSDSIDNPFE